MSSDSQRDAAPMITKKRLQRCHKLLQWAFARLDPEQNRRLSAGIAKELADCDAGNGPCSKKGERG